ncbi:MAG: response regulator [Oscillospiraceae bacterium]|nr:response regulator [Oscillospiraceae bacterium]
MQKTIFVVDDSITNLSVAEQTLENYYNVITMTSAIRMFVFLEKIIPDLILMDVAMPEMSGFDAMIKLKSNTLFSDIPVIFLTALADSYNEAYGIELGAVDFIMKPFSEAVLLHRIRHHLSIDDLIKERTVKLEEAISASSAKSDYLSNMSHEMRTPLNAIIGMTTVGKNANDINEKNRALGVIGNASTHLLGVINNVLDMAKIEAKKFELSPIEFSFDSMLQKVLSIINYRIDEKKQTLTIVSDSKMPNFIIADEQRLIQVLTNLLSNATKFTPEYGSISLEVALESETEEDCLLRIDVVDNGIGISKEQQSSLFESFVQAESKISRDYGGSGLGLTISKCIVELMDGGIHIESELGKGTRISILVKAGRSEKKLLSLLSTRLNLDALRILVVDDSEETRSQFHDVLSQLNIKFDLAPSSYDAFRYIGEKGAYDMYFIGWRVSEIDGVELADRLTTGKETPAPVVIMYSASQWVMREDEASANKIAKALQKPFFSTEIVECINDCLCKAQGVDDTREDTLNFAGKKLLLVEDQEINREILIALLESTCIDIDCAEDGEVALNMVSQTPDKYDIIFMDVKMPRMDGLEATRHIRALPSVASLSLPIIAMTANVFAEDIRECLNAGMDDHLGKPLEVDRIHQILNKYLS